LPSLDLDRESLSEAVQHLALANYTMFMHFVQVVTSCLRVLPD
jgi:hypothetical protein